MWGVGSLFHPRSEQRKAIGEQGGSNGEDEVRGRRDNFSARLTDDRSSPSHAVPEVGVGRFSNPGCHIPFGTRIARSQPSTTYNHLNACSSRCLLRLPPYFFYRLAPFSVTAASLPIFQPEYSHSAASVCNVLLMLGAKSPRPSSLAPVVAPRYRYFLSDGEPKCFFYPCNNSEGGGRAAELITLASGDGDSMPVANR